MSTSTLLVAGDEEDPRPTGLSDFTSVVAAALSAFSRDVSYAAAIARAASAILDKQRAATLPGQSRRTKLDSAAQAEIGSLAA